MADVFATSFGVLNYSGMLFNKGNVKTPLSSIIGSKAKTIDYVTGLLVAGVFHNSGKTENGALESRAGWKGLCRKCITLLMVLVATRLDLVTGTNFIRDAVVIAFIANETISIVENAGLMGINIPPAITSAIEVLKKKSDSVDNTDQ